MLSLATFALQQQRWIVAREHVAWEAESFTVWFFTEKMCADHWYKTVYIFRCWRSSIMTISPSKNPTSFQGSHWRSEVYTVPHSNPSRRKQGRYTHWDPLSNGNIQKMPTHLMFVVFLVIVVVLIGEKHNPLNYKKKINETVKWLWPVKLWDKCCQNNLQDSSQSNSMDKEQWDIGRAGKGQGRLGGWY